MLPLDSSFVEPKGVDNYVTGEGHGFIRSKSHCMIYEVENYF